LREKHYGFSIDAAPITGKPYEIQPATPCGFDTNLDVEPNVFKWLRVNADAEYRPVFMFEKAGLRHSDFRSGDVNIREDLKNENPVSDRT
jgi:hypothetical protein